MFHTAEIQKVIEPDAYDTLFTHGYTVAKKETRHCLYYYTFLVDELKELGISLTAYCFLQGGYQDDGEYTVYTHYVARVILTLPKLSAYGARTNYVELATEKDMPFIKEAFASAMGTYFPELDTDIDTWKLNRLDYAINLDLTKWGWGIPPEEKWVKPRDAMGRYYAPKIYCDLLNRGKPRPRTKIADTHDGSYYYKCKSYTINVYDKRDESARTDQDAPKKSIWQRDDLTPEQTVKYESDVTGVLRCELQARKDNINRLRTKYKRTASTDFGDALYTPERKLSELMKDDIALDVLNRAIADISPSVPYRSHAVTVNLIKSQTRTKPKTRDKMLRLVDAINKARRYDTLQEIWSSKANRQLAKKMLDEYHVNPVVLKEKEIRLLGCSELEPLINVLQRVEMWSE